MSERPFHHRRPLAALPFGSSGHFAVGALTLGNSDGQTIGSLDSESECLVRVLRNRSRFESRFEGLGATDPCNCSIDPPGFRMSQLLERPQRSGEPTPVKAMCVGKRPKGT